MRDLSFSVSALRRTSAQFERVGSAAERDADAIESAITAEGACWGSDAAGQAFAAAYLKPAQTLLGAVLDAPPLLADIGDRLDATAAGYDRTEQGNAELPDGVMQV